MKKLSIILFLSVSLLQSCMVGPHYTRPEIKPPQKWINRSSFVTQGDSISQLKWFTLFRDTILNQLIDTALQYNVSLSNAVVRLEQSRVAYGMTRAALLPSIGYNASGQLNRPSSDAFSLHGTASWEIDFWGKLRHAKKAAYQQILASEEGVKSVKIMLISEVASLYFQMRDLDNRLRISRRTVETRTEYFKLVDKRFRGGDVAELDMLQADQQLSYARATVSSLSRQLSAIERSLNILLGKMPADVPRGFENLDQLEMPPIPEGLPSSLLEQRPDIKQSEYLLQAEIHRIGAAQAARFPNISLTGLLGVASPELSSLFDDGSFSNNATATILGPVFSFGLNRRRMEIQRKEAEIAANNYVNLYISALGEVENALVSIQTYSEEAIYRNHQAEAASRSLMLSQQRYNNGYTGYLEVLIAESAVLDSELAASATKAQQLIAYVQLYRSLGGGWQ